MQENRTGIPFRQSWDEFNACRDRNWERTAFETKEKCKCYKPAQIDTQRGLYSNLKTMARDQAFHSMRNASSTSSSTTSQGPGTTQNQIVDGSRINTDNQRRRDKQLRSTYPAKYRSSIRSSRDYLDPKSPNFDSKIYMNDRFPLDCDTERDEKKYLCVYNSDEDDNFKRKTPYGL